jgi:pimeloyl-ACP methyl ester carboxylesterase
MKAILYLHGGGHADHTRYTALIERFDTLGIIDHAFDHHATTLAGRLAEAEQELAKLKSQSDLLDSDIYIWGSSMGGHIAARLTSTHPNLAGVILQSAAAYSQAAEHIPFGPDFTAELRRKGSWQDTNALVDLDSYIGKVLVMYGENDDVIPKGLIARYTAHAVKNNGESHILIGAGHSLLRPNTVPEQNAWEQMYNLAQKFIQS